MCGGHATEGYRLDASAGQTTGAARNADLAASSGAVLVSTDQASQQIAPFQVQDWTGDQRLDTDIGRGKFALQRFVTPSSSAKSRASGARKKKRMCGFSGLQLLFTRKISL